MILKLVRGERIELSRPYGQKILLTTIVFTTKHKICLWSGLCLYHRFEPQPKH